MHASSSSPPASSGVASALSSIPSTALPAAPLSSSRSMSYAYARKMGVTKPYDYRVNEQAFAFGQLTDYLIKVVPKWIKFAVAGPAQSNLTHNEPTLYTTPEHLEPLCRFLRDHVNTQFKQVLDITAVDFPERAARFEVVYHLLSPRLNCRLRIKVQTPLVGLIAAGAPPP